MGRNAFGKMLMSDPGMYNHDQVPTCMRKLKSMSPPTTVMAVLMREEGCPTCRPPCAPPNGVLKLAAA